ncbi:MAG: outer membrane protein assembly factor BamE [Sulfuritalea sp.]|nr:outer membrane protein assembly factor BamE [Sulfuritalea sp.]
MRKKWIASGLCLALAACASYDGAGLRPGASGDEVRSVMGEPGTIWREADGGATWEYPRGPQGVHTYMARLGSDGRLREIRQVLNTETFASIRPGTTTREEVRRLLGAPARELYFVLKDERVWDYRYYDVVSKYDYAFSVHFNPAGVVSGTETTPDDPRFLSSGADGLN